ncbi:hypothetical protein [Streptomyces atratus]|uniref:hypothetical protein n=1 Tax=Streptomyces atratus TaxID=1893 RepID=UPI0033EFD7F1
MSGEQLAPCTDVVGECAANRDRHAVRRPDPGVPGERVGRQGLVERTQRRPCGRGVPALHDVQQDRRRDHGRREHGPAVAMHQAAACEP